MKRKPDLLWIQVILFGLGVGILVGLTGIDTRALTALIRDRGMPNAVIAHNARGLFDLDALLEKAKAAGIQPIQQWNAPNAGLAFPLQNLMGSYGDPTPINDWIFQKPGATIDTPCSVAIVAITGSFSNSVRLASGLQLSVTIPSTSCARRGTAARRPSSG